MREEFISARYMVLGSLGFALMACCVKVLGMRGIPVLEIIAARAAVSLVLSASILKVQNIPLTGNNKPFLLLRGLVGSIALVFVYEGIVRIPFAEATAIQYLNPLFTVFLAAFFLGEKIQKATLIAVLVSMIGMLFVVQPNWFFVEKTQQVPMLGYMLALAGAFGSGLAYVLVRYLSKTEDPNVIIFYFPLVALPFSLILLGDDFVMPSGSIWLLLLLVGVFTQIGQWGFTKSIQAAPAGKAMSFSYIQIIFAVIIGIFYFDEIPNLYALLGMGLIISGTMLRLLFRDG